MPRMWSAVGHGGELRWFLAHKDLLSLRKVALV